MTKLVELLNNPIKGIENWSDIENYQNYYQVSTFGRVRSLDRIVDGRMGYNQLKKGKILSASKSKVGYLRVLLCNSKIRKNISIHRLVALAFIPNPLNYNQVNHIDGDKLNNCVWNLEWCDQTYNNRHARQMGLNIAKSGKESHTYGFKNHQSHALKNIKTGEVKPIVEVALEYPQWTRRHITMMIKGERTNKTDYILIEKNNNAE